MSRRSRRPRHIRAIRSRPRDGLRAIAGALLALRGLAACTSGQPDPSDPAQTLASDPVALADRGVVSLRRGRIIVRSSQSLAELADSVDLATPTGGSSTR